MSANLENSAVAKVLETSGFIPIPKKGNSKECSDYCTIALISHASKVKLKFLKARLQQYSTWTVNFQMFKAGLEKVAEPEIELPTSVGSSKKQKNSRKTSTCALLTMPKSLTVWITKNLWKIKNKMHTNCVLNYVPPKHWSHNLLSLLNVLYMEMGSL